MVNKKCKDFSKDIKNEWANETLSSERLGNIPQGTRQQLTPFHCKEDEIFYKL